MAILDLYKPPFTFKKILVAIIISLALFFIPPIIVGLLLYTPTSNISALADFSSDIGVVLGGGHMALYILLELYHSIKTMMKKSKK